MFQYFPASKWYLRSVVLFPYSYPSFRTGVSTVKVSNATTVYNNLIKGWGTGTLTEKSITLIPTNR